MPAGYSVPPNASIVSRMVAHSIHCAIRGEYVWTQMALVDVPGPLSNHTGQFTYGVSNLGNAVARLNRGYDWKPGDSQRAVRPLTSELITAMINSTQLDPTGFADPTVAGISTRNPVEDSRMQIPEHLAILYALREWELYDLLADDTVFGNGAGGLLSFAGAEALDKPDETGDQKPLHDIRDVCNAVTFWAAQRPGQFVPVAIMDKVMMTIMMTNPHFHGGGAGGGGLQVGGSGSGTAGLADESGVTAVLKKLGIEEVHIMKAIGNTANQGGSNAIGFMATPFLWIGLLPRKRRYKIQKDTDIGPDGAFAIAQEFEPWVKNWGTTEAEFKYWAGRDNSLAYDIRGATFGRCFRGNIVTGGA